MREVVVILVLQQITIVLVLQQIVVVLVVEEGQFVVQSLDWRSDQKCVDQCQTALGQLLMLLRLLVVWDVWFWVF